MSTVYLDTLGMVLISDNEMLIYLNNLNRAGLLVGINRFKMLRILRGTYKNYWNPEKGGGGCNSTKYVPSAITPTFVFVTNLTALKY